MTDPDTSRRCLEEMREGRPAKGGPDGIITTSSYSSEARDFTDRMDIKTVLIDGQMLAALMVDHGIGVSTTQIYEVKKIDSDYFSDE